MKGRKEECDHRSRIMNTKRPSAASGADDGMRMHACMRSSAPLAALHWAKDAPEVWTQLLGLPSEFEPLRLPRPRRGSC